MDTTTERAKQCYIKHHGTEPEQAGFYHYQEWDTGIFVYAHNKNIAKAYITEQRTIRRLIWSFGPAITLLLALLLTVILGYITVMSVIYLIGIYAIVLVACAYKCKKCRKTYNSKLSVLYYK